ncbi:hypothetical protein, variant [Aphanomyces invadans]|uniref:FAM194 C-terminal domain-containing protein n=1 Tax=Aphanomyces invadans TaxID=157072 RepID=A0A024UNZ2_9STRA|nr:hypothetical protein H310_01881 [Aphanomyces invadans]XP_008863436.1 hypothetical protein, variant [Aphanomyces invadans]ETW07342.1 hypothetical protein H310_01881 [Aphanomyces invadans]ETW07343.1 hypothetical protein, variant [Aphanomyces invadans]|eukprot:XP_008863435.1 hypothetical protein H310_01881 [Aphanomyces invadans]
MRVVTPKEIIVVDEGVSMLDEVLQQADGAALLHLNVAFNRVRRLQALERARNLKLLNVNHNMLQSLCGVETLTALCVLKASYNKLSSLEGIGALAQLSELWISHNQLELPELKWLQSLDKLTSLLVDANPCCKEPSYKMVVVDLVPSLTRLDSVVVSDDMRTRASAFRNSHEGKAVAKTLHRLVPASKPKPLNAAGTVQRPSSETNQHDDDGKDNAQETDSTRAAPRAPTSAPLPKDRKASRLDDFLKSFPVQEYIPAPDVDEYTSFSIADAISGLPTFGGSSKQPSVASKPKLSSAGRGTKQSTRPLANAKICPPAAAASKATSNADQPSPASTTNALLSTSVDESNHFVPNEDDDDDILDMEQYTRTQAMPSSKSLHACTSSPDDTSPGAGDSSVLPPLLTLQLNPSELVVKYAGSNVAAVAVRVDGSAQCRWPNNSIAVTVDKESNAKDMYRLFGTYKDGKVALSFDGHGVGFINYANGKTMLSTTSGGDGLLMNAHNGAIDRQWFKAGPPWSTDITAKLSDHLGVSFSLRANQEYAIRIFFACNGLRHAVVNGFNDAVVDPTACDAIFGKPKGPVKKKLAKLKHVDLVSAIQKCTAQL